MPKIFDMLKRIPDIGREQGRFDIAPRRVVRDRQTDWSKPASATACLLWALGAAALLHGCYNLACGALGENILRAVEGKAAKRDPSVPVPAADPVRVVDWAVGPRMAFSIDFPQARQLGHTTPQLALLSCGTTTVALSNVIPERLSNKPLPLLLAVLYGAMLVLCVHPPASALGGRASFREAWRLTVLYIGYTVSTLWMLVVLTTFAFVDIVGLTGWLVYLPWLPFVLAPMIVLLVRGFFASFAELYAFSKKRLFATWLVAGILSAGVGPLVFVPAVYLIVRFDGLWGLLL